MADNDRPPVVIGLENTAGPFENLGIGVRVVLQVKHHEIQTAAREKLVIVVVVGSVMPAIVRASSEEGYWGVAKLIGVSIKRRQQDGLLLS